MIADAATEVEDVYSLKQIQTVIRPRSYLLLCQFLTKFIIVINLVCACVKTSAEDNDFQRLSKGERDRGGGGREGEREGEREREKGRERECVCVLDIERFLCFGLSYNIILGQFWFARY